MDEFELVSQTFPPLTEKDVTKQCLDYLLARGWYPVRLQSGRFIMPDPEVIEALERAGVRYRWSTVGEVGIPDYAVLKNDFLMELKAPGKKPSRAQIRKAFVLMAGYRLKVCAIDGLERLVSWLDHNY